MGQSILNNPDQVIMTVSEFLAQAESSDLFQQVAEDAAAERKKTIFNESSARRDEEWSLLANQVVGGEISMLSTQRSSQGG